MDLLKQKYNEAVFDIRELIPIAKYLVNSLEQGRELTDTEIKIHRGEIDNMAKGYTKDKLIDII